MPIQVSVDTPFIGDMVWVPPVAIPEPPPPVKPKAFASGGPVSGPGIKTLIGETGNPFEGIMAGSEKAMSAVSDFTEQLVNMTDAMTASMGGAQPEITVEQDYNSMSLLLTFHAPAQKFTYKMASEAIHALGPQASLMTARDALRAMVIEALDKQLNAALDALNPKYIG